MLALDGSAARALRPAISGTFDSPERLRGKAKINETQRLGEKLGAVAGGIGHSCICPKDMRRLEGWIEARDTASVNPDPFTQELMDAIVDAAGSAE